MEIKVENFAIIDSIHIHFKPGFNILSGETGAGKSVVLKSLSLLMGEKSSTEIIRSGEDQAVVEGAFDISKRPDIKSTLKDMGIQVDDDLLIVRRILLRQGKSRVYLNGQMSTLNFLQNLVAPLVEVTGHHTPLIEMTGQHESRNLLSRSYHCDLLDRYAETLDLRSQYESVYAERETAIEELEKLRGSSGDSEQRLDFLKFQKSEIDALPLEEGDEEKLEQTYRSVRNREKIDKFLTDAEAVLSSDDDSATERLKAILQRAAEAAKWDSRIEEKIQPLEHAKSIIDDVAYELGKLSPTGEIENESVDQIESKIALLRKMQRKYGQTAAEIIEAKNKIVLEIHELENRDS